MHFLGSKFTQNALAAGAPPRTPLGELKRSPDPVPISGGRFAAREREKRGIGRREMGKGVLGKGKREGREGKRRGRERGRRRERKGEVCVIGVRGDRRP